MTNCNQQSGLRLGFIGLGVDATDGSGERLSNHLRVEVSKGKMLDTRTMHSTPLFSLMIAVHQQLSGC